MGKKHTKLLNLNEHKVKLLILFKIEGVNEIKYLTY